MFFIPQEKASYTTEDSKLILQLNTLPFPTLLILIHLFKVDCASSAGEYSNLSN